ncbi:hypothetical protein BC829DRAFT_476284 [Chytridium lagenaria]|nr:hypothetical protein BC829DRAFT_476284 [Chytridium lagenaria]
MSAKPPRGKSGGKRRQTDREDGGGSASVMSSKGVSAAPEVVYKMSKKIAQLTKVIYYLNTKNEDHNVEVQSLIDAYEEELSDAIKDGTGQIQELRAKLDECNIKIQAQDAVIQSYLETISQNEREPPGSKSEVEKSEGLTSISALSTESLRSDHDAEVKRICDKYEEKIAKLTETHEKQIIELQLQSSKTIKVYSDECKSAQEQLKDIVDVLSKQHDEKIRVYQNEAKDVREFYEAKLKDAEKESKATVVQLKEEVQEMSTMQASLVSESSKAESLKRYQERAFKQLLDEMEEMEKNMKEDKVTSLLHQEAELKAAFDSEMKAKIIQLDELRISLLQEKQNEINNLLEKIIKQSDEAKIALEKEKEQFNIQKAALEESSAILKTPEHTSKTS